MTAASTPPEKPLTPESTATSALIDPREPALRNAFEHLRNAVDQLERAILLALPNTGPAPSTVPLVRRDVMKPREYAEHMRVNVRKVHGWIRGGMPHFLIEGRIRIRVIDADAWLETRSESSTSTSTAKQETARTRKPKTQTQPDLPNEVRAKSKAKRGK